MFLYNINSGLSALHNNVITFHRKLANITSKEYADGVENDDRVVIMKTMKMLMEKVMVMREKECK